MAAYAALVSLMHTIEQIEHHPRPPISLDKSQVESLTEKVTFLQDFLEDYSQHIGYSKEADPFEMYIADVAYEAEDVIESNIVDLIHGGSTSYGEKISSIGLFEGLQRVIELMDLMKKDVMEIKEKMGVQHKPKGHSSTSATSLGSASTRHNITMVGFDDLLIEVMAKLTRGQLDRQIIPIVGMGGTGKTTLARNIYQNQVVVQCFDILAWVTVSQDYRMRAILLQLVKEDEESLRRMSEFEIGLKVHQRLSGRRYLIVMDDIWDIQVWDQLRRFFPDNNNGSRIVITTRISNYQLTDSYVVKMGFLDKDKSWSLLSKIVFGEEGCPAELEKTGKKIVENCRGLPLSIVVVGGLLAQSERTLEFYEYIAKNLNSIVNLEDDESCLKILHMSYDKLPVYLKPCFLYMGVFPEDEKINVSKLVKLWVAEGFLKPIKGKDSEDIAKEYLKELINRNLVLVNEVGCTGNIKYCNIHDLLRDLCLREVQKQRFYNIITKDDLDDLQVISTQRRVVIPDNESHEEIHNALQFMSLARSLICDFTKVLPLRDLKLLRIMSYSHFGNRFLEDMSQLVNSRCFVLNAMYYIFPSSIHLFWSLHTLIVQNTEVIHAPLEIWKMPQLRHLEFKKGLYLPDPLKDETHTVMENLKTLKKVVNFKCHEEMVGRIPNIKKLKVSFFAIKKKECCLNNLDLFHSLQSFSCECSIFESDFLETLIFPRSLKKLTVSSSCIQPWEHVLEKIGLLPLLEKLVLISGSFNGHEWETVEGHFPSLKYLRIQNCSDLEYWTTESSHFPRLEQLVLCKILELKEIPSEIGDISTLKSIELVDCCKSVVISANNIVEEQKEMYGEVGIQVQVRSSSEQRSLSSTSLVVPSFIESDLADFIYSPSFIESDSADSIDSRTPARNSL